MKLKNLESTWICQFNKPENKTVLEGFVARRDKSAAELTRLYKFAVCALVNTPAWGISGVNKLVNDLTDSLRAVRTHAKRGKTSAPAASNKILNTIKEFGDKEAVARYCGNYKLKPLLTEEELDEIASMDE